MAAYRKFREAPEGASTAQKVGVWIDNRFPSLGAFVQNHLTGYYAPKNFNWWYIWGSLALVVLVLQIVSGIFLAMHYKPDAGPVDGIPGNVSVAFASVEYVMREVYGGWFIRYMHSTGASAFFIVVYLHMFRGMLYGSYRKPRELVWIFGCAIFLALMAEAFMGYLLPWGQMSFWGAQVIINLFSAIPVIGPDLAIFIRGDFSIGDATLNRFFSFHIIAVPLVLIGLVVGHIFALHDVGSNNPDGVEITGPNQPVDANGHPVDGIAFHPYYTVHDIFGASLFFIVFFAVVFFAPELGGYFLEYNNFIPADPFAGPAHIAPVWYFTPFYSMLRATTEVMVWAIIVAMLLSTGWMWIMAEAMTYKRKVSISVAVLIGAAALVVLDAKFWGVVVMGASVMIFFFLPWLDHCPVKSIRYRPTWHKVIYAIFVLWFVVLGYLGIQAPSAVFTLVSQIGTFCYFAFFLLMPWWSRKGPFKTPPERITFKPH